LPDSATKSKQDGKIWLKCVFVEGGGGGSEVKCIIFNENNDNPYGIHNNYIKLSLVFHPMIFFLGNKKI
jgi:hypothetical protein